MKAYVPLYCGEESLPKVGEPIVTLSPDGSQLYKQNIKAYAGPMSPDKVCKNKIAYDFISSWFFMSALSLDRVSIKLDNIMKHFWVLGEIEKSASFPSISGKDRQLSAELVYIIHFLSLSGKLIMPFSHTYFLQ